MARAQREIGAALLEVTRHADVPSEALRDDGLIEAIPELAALGETPQDPHWHPEGDVLVHSLWAADLAASHALEHDLDADRRQLLVTASLFHDVGKPQTTRRMNGRISSHGHAERGGEVFRAMGRRLALPRPLVDAVAAIVETHMAHLSVRGDPSPRAVRRLQHRLAAAGTSLDDWGIVVRCDGEARGPAARPDASQPWRRVAARLQ
ncbi:tRNA nucleotidyltransferase (CCA-adding enzyme) [Agromyces flavus]|uniref:HDIG domain-containing protein n=1 Tax=Agromyces flavus TaxID=589382 RepID=A0A1H1WC26_9MICO|nr:HD domain-containing protein [Agromyces flavus]MCP2366141.1 tRNA nucleotidyltransferase (CCA-adding enzyme) [Agromyces flavus]GGI44082.1 HD family phosphohydrolase [Agromyces flavus]SDS94767.1 HDIG domain-containing protein [Agromyces flavus]